jgi:hypothetical protein
MKGASRIGSFLPIILKTSKSYPTAAAAFTQSPQSHRFQKIYISHLQQQYTPIVRSIHSSSLSMSSKIPATPYAYLSGDSNGCDLSKLNATIANTESAKQKAHEVGSKIKASLVQHRAAIEKNAPIAERKILQKSLDDLAEVALRQHKEYYEGNEKGRKSSRLASLSFTLAEYVRQKAYSYFLETGRLMPQSTLSNDITDEEYLSGIISMSHDLSRYAVGRATERDAHSVMLARDLVSNMLNHLMEYDFRNGNLRRKYGKCKKNHKTFIHTLISPDGLTD